MAIVIVSDIHSNMQALDAVLRDADARAAIDGVWCLGDIVGYGADPGGVIAALRARGAIVVAGNHDRAACGLMSTDEFNRIAAEAVAWTAEQLSNDEKLWLGGLPLTAVEGDWTLVHGSLRAPEWEYLLDGEQAAAQFALQTTPYSLVGHSHLPFVVRESAGAGGDAAFERLSDGDVVEPGDERLIVNPASVWQPRDGDPRASYVLYDESAATITWRRVTYDIEGAQRAIRSAGLPGFLADRLAEGR
jgi:diadenosine tetraphosphatase ApaH/serine/threonine PP2A family protein phosphatase